MTRTRHRSGRYRLAYATVAGAAALALTACGSSSSSSTSASSGTPAASPTGSPITFMVITTVGNPVNNYPEAPSAAKAAAAAVNAAGGVNGHPINVEFCNDNLDPNQATECGRKAVADKVAAVVGDISTFADNYMPILKAAGIPSVGNLNASALEATGGNSFPFSPGTAVFLQAQSSYLIKNGKTKIAIVYIDIPVVAPLLKGIEGGIPKMGGEVVAKIPVPPTATDMSSYTAALRASGANGALFVLGEAQKEQLLQSNYQAGITSTVTGGASTFSPEALKKLGPAVEGLYIINSVLPSSLTSNSGIAQFNQEMDAFSMTDPRTDGALNAWAAVHIVSDIMTKKDLTGSTGLIDALNGAGPINFAGIAPFNWSKPISTYAPLRVFTNQMFTGIVKSSVIVPDGESSTSPTNFWNVLGLPDNMS